MLFELTDHIRARASDSFVNFLSSAPADYQLTALDSTDAGSGFYAFNLSQTRKLETERRCAAERRDILQREVVAMEIRLGIICRWEPSSPEYQRTLSFMSTRKYQKALDHLQRLVVQRLFELHRLNVAQTGMLISRESTFH
jgi:hypothetical protein